ncbi:unnamed protein product [Owenia fusiformis]|uniref:C2H2-type domain-containing protein n=1 Tax=Owenia fusiformis TaxID=6347 RepID=A0A8S4PDA9_OWEFU|nr:unnamed protein product [Owenia fusiformis]
MPELDSSNISLATASKLTKRNSKINNADFSKFVKIGDKRYKCLICHAEATFKWSIIRHLIRHDKQKNCLECPICFQKNFIYPKELENHIKVEHMGIKPVCEECGMQFKSTFTLKRHIRSIHKKGGKDIICDECGKHYQRQDSFLDHQRKHHQGVTLPCVSCNKGFANASNKRQHEAICGKTLGVVCEICSKVFKSRKICNRHIKDVHTQLEPQLHMCNECAATFKYRKSLLRHGRMKGHNIDNTVE